MIPGLHAAMFQALELSGLSNLAQVLVTTEVGEFIGPEDDGFNIARLLLRAVVGVTVFAHGYNHVWGGGKIAGTGRWFESLGLKPGIMHAWMASVTELVCGPLLIVGLLTPLAAAGVVGVMVVAFLTNHRPNGFFIFNKGEGYEYVLNLAVVGLALGGLGAGEWSIDALLHLKSMSGLAGLGITAVAGIGGALLLLAACWRPAPRQDDAA